MPQRLSLLLLEKRDHQHGWWDIMPIERNLSESKIFFRKKLFHQNRSQKGWRTKSEVMLLLTNGIRKKGLADAFSTFWQQSLLSSSCVAMIYCLYPRFICLSLLHCWSIGSFLCWTKISLLVLQDIFREICQSRQTWWDTFCKSIGMSHGFLPPFIFLMCC